MEAPLGRHQLPCQPNWTSFLKVGCHKFRYVLCPEARTNFLEDLAGFLFFLIKYWDKKQIKRGKVYFDSQFRVSSSLCQEGVATRGCLLTSQGIKKQKGWECQHSPFLFSQEPPPSYELVPPIFRGSLPTQLILSENSLPDTSKDVLH